MTVASSAPWCPSAAYLYVLHLDNAALAWEYLRRHPDYRHDWAHRHCNLDSASKWGLHMLEDPALDARHALPAWLPGGETVVHLYPDANGTADATWFRFWTIRGDKHVFYDGSHMLLQVRGPSGYVRSALSPGLGDGTACTYAVKGSMPKTYAGYRRVNSVWEALSGAADVLPAATTGPRPGALALFEMQTLQALDATMAGATYREIAQAMIGADTVATSWHPDSALRSRVRRLVRRGKTLMRGGYRRLAQLDRTQNAR